MNAVPTGEYLRCDNRNTDTTTMSITTTEKLGFPAEQYPTLEFKVRYKYDRDTPSIFAIYFGTSIDPTPAENKTVKPSLKSTDTNGEWEVYTIDMSAIPTWIGNIVYFRFDQFYGAKGYMDIDYIKFIEDPNYVPVENKEEEILGIVNGDAEGKAITFTSPSAKVTIVEDETKAGNHVYQFTGSGSGKVWTYAVHRYPFETGKRYKISFDARGVSDTKGNKMDMRLLVNIQYPSNSGETHYAGNFILPADGSWVHYETVYTMQPMTKAGDTLFSCYIDPPTDNSGGIFQLDNVIVEEVK